MAFMPHFRLLDQDSYVVRGEPAMKYQSMPDRTRVPMRGDSWADTATAWDEQVDAVFRRAAHAETPRRERLVVGPDGRSLVAQGKG
jgi:hypothetical protein